VTVISPLPSTSAFWFYGRLRPTAATRFNVAEFRVARGTRLEVFHDGIALWSKPGTTAFTTLEQARDLLQLVAAAYGLISSVALDFTLEGWVEATGANFRGAVVGFGVDPRGHDPYLPTRSRRSIDMRRAARLAVAIQKRPGWRLAVRDVHSALRDGGDDGFVFAYRALEDVARALSGQTGQLNNQDWAKLHQLSGTTKSSFLSRIEPLVKARRAAAHGNEGDPELQFARANRDAVIDIARRVVADTLERAGLPLRVSDLR
jgi:hypothetical protein